MAFNQHCGRSHYACNTVGDEFNLERPIVIYHS